MCSPRPNGGLSGVSPTNVTRRRLLAVGGAVAVGGLAGCFDRVASAVTNTTSTPAAVFMGRLTAPAHVARLTPTISGASSTIGSSGVALELEGWVTSTGLMAQNHNSSRSNRTRGIRGGDSDSDGDGGDDGSSGGPGRANYNNTRSNRSGVRAPDILDDDLDEDDETFRTVARLDEQLKEATTTAWAAISKRSARTGRNPELDREVLSALDEMDAALAEMQAVLERCSDESCVMALENVADREADVDLAREYAENGEWDAFGLRVDGGGDNDILTGDYLLPSSNFDPTGSYTPAERAALFRYIDGVPLVFERCTVCLPDAEVPGGNGSIAEEVTPRRIIDYLTGHSSGSGRVYSWGDADSDGDGLGDCDDTDDDLRPSAVCGTTPHFVAEMSKSSLTDGGLVAFRGDDGSVVVASSLTASNGSSMVGISSDGGVDESPNPNRWGRGEIDKATPVLYKFSVSQVTVQPPGCPVPFPALFYVGRGLSDDQLVYSGGWVIDDTALYANSQTILSMVGAAPIVGVDYGDVDGDGYGDAVAKAASGGRPGQLSSGTIDELVESGALSAGAKKGYDAYKSTSSENAGARVDGDEYGFVTNVCVDASVLHLVNAARASNEVKFKAGAELSGQVN